MATKHPLDHALTEAPLWAPGHGFQPHQAEPRESEDPVEIRKQIKREQRAYKREMDRLATGVATPARKRSHGAGSGLPFGLSAGQLATMRLLIEGKTHAQIARDTCKSIKTVQEHAWRAVQKIGGTNSLHAAVLLDRVLRLEKTMLRE